ncbi:MAG: type II secretion system protein [Thermoguttaceae bacterium]
MLFVHRSMQNRRAFTLIELLTVVVIIGILAGLVTAAALQVRSTVLKSTHAIELQELEMALQAYKERFGEYPPDFTGNTTQNETLFHRHMRKAFPRCDDATIGTIWTNVGQHQRPETALAFWLGGVDDGSGTPIGFSANPIDPFDATTTSRIGPFFEKFDPERLLRVQPGVWRYYPTVEAGQDSPPDANKAIRYYRAENGSYAGKGSIPFKDSRVEPTPDNYGWINPRSVQIISPGLQGRAFDNSGANPVFPAGFNYEERHLEMLSNFTGGTMEDALP